MNVSKQWTKYCQTKIQKIKIDVTLFTKKLENPEVVDAQTKI